MVMYALAIEAILGIVSAVLAATGAITSGAVAGAQAAKKKKQALTTQNKNETWFNNERYKDAMNTEANRSLTKEVGARIQTNKEVAARAGDILGLDEMTIAQNQEKENKSYAEAIGAMAQQGEKDKEAATEKFVNTNNNVAQQLTQAAGQQADAWGTALSGTAQAVGAIGGVLPSSTKTA
ncbi:MAG: hypothetical protein J6V51_03785 [Bacteroidales bacterium]|nr:hypothetical protein [Bacteroidales bacterium]